LVVISLLQNEYQPFAEVKMQWERAKYLIISSNANLKALRLQW